MRDDLLRNHAQLVREVERNRVELSDITPPTADYRRILEGSCPHCAVTLQREDDCGRCPNCHTGWSRSNDTVTMHLSVDVPASLQFLSRDS